MEDLLAENASEDINDFNTAFTPYGEKSASGLKLRREGFSAADTNGNGMASLAELELSIKHGLQKQFPKKRVEHLFKTYRPSYIYAYNSAKNLHTGSDDVLPGAKTATEDDYVSFSEFRVFTVYLRIYAAMFDVFADVDGDSEGRTAEDDMRIDRDEFLRWYDKSGGGHSFKAFETVNSEEQAIQLFNELDTDGSGKIIFSEWSASIREIEIVENTFMGVLLSGNLKPTKLLAEGKKGVVRTNSGSKTPLLRPCTPKVNKFANGKRMVMPTKVAGAYMPSKKSSNDLKDFISAFQPFAEKTIMCSKRRKAAFKGCDTNASGSCSLAEITQYCRSTLKKEHDIERGEQLFDLFRPSFIRAFSASKAIAQTGNPNDDNYINFSEFRILNVYLCVYAGMADAFMKIDGGGAGVTEDDDRRVEKEEWMKSYHTFSTSTFIGLTGINTDEDASSVFKSMDLDGKGMVLLSEFCEFIKNKEMENKTALEKLLNTNTMKATATPKE